MISKVFQGIINKITPILDRSIGIVDKSLTVLASTEGSEIGKVIDYVDFIALSSSDVVRKEEVTFKCFGNRTIGEYVVYVSGVDEVALRYGVILAASLESTVKLDFERHDKADFMKEVILENVLPGDIFLRAKELKLAEKAERVCLLVRFTPRSDVSVLDIVRAMFPDQNKDFVVGIGDSSVVVIKGVLETITDRDLEVLASSIVSTLSSEYYLKVSVGVGPVVRNIKMLAESFRGAQISLEVHKVFSIPKGIALYSQLGIARLIYQLPTSLCKTFLNEVFKKSPISDLDEEIMFTISKLFENSLNVSEASRKLFVHRNTLVYRLEKIRRITGLDLREFEDAVTFKVALMVHKYISGDSA